MSHANPQLDPVTVKSVNTDLTPQEKIKGLHAILEKAKTGMLTTRSSEGHLHSRAMAPCSSKSLVGVIFISISITPAILEKEPTQVNLYFIANNASHKFDEIEHDSNVNVSFYDEASTNWASFTGTAKISQDKALIYKFWHYS
jgi:general stress protein 26